MAEVEYETFETDANGNYLGVVKRLTRGNSPPDSIFIIKRAVIRSTRPFFCQPSYNRTSLFSWDKVHSEILNSRFLLNRPMPCYADRLVELCLDAHDPKGSGNQISLKLFGEYEPFDFRKLYPFWIPHTTPELAAGAEHSYEQRCGYLRGIMEGLQAFGEGGSFEIDVICRDANLGRVRLSSKGSKLEGEDGRVQASQRPDDLVEITVRNTASVPNRVHLAAVFT